VDDKDILHFYTSFKDDSRGWLGLYRQHFTQFVTILVAVLAISLTALHNLRDEVLLLCLVALGPMCNILLARRAMHSCNKYYLRYWEHEATSYKLYNILKCSKEINKRIEEDESMFPDDKHLFPARWLSRVTENIDETSDEKKYRTTDRFVEARVKAKDSSNRSVRYTFILLIAVSAIVALAMYAKVWQNWGKSNIQEESSSPKATANMSLQQTP
jgi:hypothetical protein